MSGSSPWSPAIPACDDRSMRPTSPARRRLIAAHDPDRSPQKGTSLYAVRKLYRDPSRRLVAGVASGIAGHLGVPVYAVRVTFVALLPFDGLGALLYAVFWAVLSSAPGVPPKKRDKRQMLTYLALSLGVLLVQQMIGLGGGSNMFLGWLIAIIAIGAGIIWHLADPDRRRRWTSAVPNAPWLGAVVDETSRRSYLLRIVGGRARVIGGIIGISLGAAPHAGAGFTGLLGGLLYALVALAGVAVVVADIDVSERVAALAAAAREALVNAARHAKVASVSLYAEVEADAISVFVRDRGVGFEPAAVGPDRHGVRGSIMGRMERHGGTSEIRSEPGNGTEVRLFMPTPEGRERHG